MDLDPPFIGEAAAWGPGDFLIDTWEPGNFLDHQDKQTPAFIREDPDGDADVTADLWAYQQALPHKELWTKDWAQHGLQWGDHLDDIDNNLYPWWHYMPIDREGLEQSAYDNRSAPRITPARHPRDGGP